MKVDIIKKFKWYIVGFILVAIMLSVSLSFCTWDSLSLQVKMSASESGGYTEKPTRYKLAPADDINNNDIADVGEIVTLGKYYQDANITNKTDIRWIVVHSENNQLTLLAEKVMAFGSFWGNYYYNGSSWVYATKVNGTFYQNYSQSTVRAWLNSSTRTDGGTTIDKNSKDGVAFKGFLSEAFTADEQAYIISKTISGIKGYGKDGKNPSTPTEDYITVTDKVWIPSWSEIFGSASPWGTANDGGDKKFDYFYDAAYGIENARLKGFTTAFASSGHANYTYIDATHVKNSQESSTGGNVWWWLRAPVPTDYTDSLMVFPSGTGYGMDTYNSYGGVRPAICVWMI